MSTPDAPNPTTRRQLAGSAARLALAMLFVAGWRYGVWLIVVTMAAAAITLAASDYLAERTLAQRVATWVLFAPAGAVDGSELEQAIAADLACVASDDPAVLEACCARVDEVPDPWLRSLATERLQAARALLDSRSVPVRPGVAGSLARTRTLWLLSAFATTLVLFGASTGERLVLVPLALTLGVIATGGNQARVRTGLRDSMCREAMTPPVRGRVVMPEPAVVAATAGLASNSSRVVARARVLASSADRSRRETALMRLAAVEPAVRLDAPSLRRSTLLWAALCGAAVAATELL